MSEEISLPEMDDKKKEEMRQAIRNRRNKGKEPEVESSSPPQSGPSSDLIRKLAAHAARGVIAPEPQKPEEEAALSPSPCMLVSGVALLALGIAFYFGHKYWKSLGVEELALE